MFSIPLPLGLYQPSTATVRLLAVCISLLSQCFPAGKSPCTIGDTTLSCLNAVEEAETPNYPLLLAKKFKKCFPKLIYVPSPKICSFDCFLPKKTSVDPK